MSTLKSYDDADLDTLDRFELSNLLSAASKLIFDKKKPLVDRNKYGNDKRDDILAKLLKVSSGATMARIRRNEEGKRNPQRVSCLRRLREEFDFIYYNDGSVDRPVDDLEIVESEQVLRTLAGKLAHNLVDVSTSLRDGSKPHNRILDTSKSWVEKKTGQPMRERFIAVTGAGASSAASPEKNQIPGTKETIKKLREAFKKEGYNVEKTIDRKVDDLVKMGNYPDREGYEVQLKALLYFDRDLVIKHLKQLCGYRNTPSLLYEVIAHLLKHRFLDAIVSFNNDELLDNAIEDEMPNRDDYRYIYTAGQCPNELEDLYVDHRMRVPLYVKCHGTISHSNSLPFSENDTLVMDRAIQQHLEELFTAKAAEQNQIIQEELPLNIMLFGCSMRNDSFNSLIQRVVKNKKTDVTFWVFDQDLDLKNRLERKFRDLNQNKHVRVRIYAYPLVQHKDMEKALVELWTYIQDSFQVPYKPKGIGRHQLLSHVFRNYSPTKLVKEKTQKNYLTDRLYVEIGLLMIETDGFIHLRQLAGGRGGKIYESIRKFDDKSPPIHHYLENMGLKIYRGFMHDTYYIPDNSSRENDGDNLIKYVWKKIMDNDLGCNRALQTEKSKQRFISLAKEVRKRRLAMINPNYKNVHDNLFSSIGIKDVMHTSLAWIHNYRRMMDNHKKWDLMLAITEEGSFLNFDIRNKNIDLSDKYFELIVAKNNLRKEKNDQLKALKNELNLLTELRHRPWWLHNKHMVIFLKLNDPDNRTGQWEKDWLLQEGYFYTHRMLSRRITPVRIRGKKDLERLMIMFAIYWLGSTTHDTADQLKIVTSDNQIDKIINELLDKYPGGSN